MAADRNRVSRGTASGNRISVYRNNTSYVEGNAVRKANSALPEKKRRQQVAPQTEVKPARRKERAPRLTGKSALLFGVCAVITFGSIANYLQLKDKVSVKTAEISNVTMQTESVKAQNDAIDTENKEVKFVHFSIGSQSPIVGKKLEETHLREDYGALLVAVQRGDEYVYPTRDLAFKADDILWIVGDPQKLTRLKG